jgi:predicted HTH domain antitoxin
MLNAIPPMREEYSMSLEITDDILHAAHLSADELRREIAILLFQQERLTLGQAAELDFQRMLAERGIAVHYGIAEFEDDLTTMRSLGDL